MSPRRASRGATALSGVLLLDKAPDWTSHDLVAKLRSLTGEGRIGHCGTLDPAATGLMVMLIGGATKLSDDFLLQEKRYTATICFGAATTTDDAQGEVQQHSPVPPQVFCPDYAQALLAQFTGAQDQIPPDYSALKVDGKVAYRQARKGQALQQKPRPIEVYRARLIQVAEPDHSWTVDFQVSKGSYIRALARDIGLAAGTHAHLSQLRRLSSGSFDLSDATCIGDIVAATDPATGGDPLAVADFFVPRETLLKVTSLDRLRQASIAGRRVGPCVMTVGVFDGVHPGHQALLAAVVARARATGLQSAVLTFDQHPQQLLHPGHAPQALMSLAEKEEALRACGIDQVIVLPFTQQLAQQSASDFLLKTLPSLAQAREVIVGSNFRCGKAAEQGPEHLQAILRETDSELKLSVVELERDESGMPYSSTRLRQSAPDAAIRCRLKNQKYTSS